MIKTAILLPMLTGLLVLLIRPPRRLRQIILEAAALLTSLLVFLRLTLGGGEERFFALTPAHALVLRLDGVGGLFAGLVAFLWPLAMLYAFEYMEHEHGQNRFLSIYLATYGVVLGIASAGTLLTLYVFYEFLTLFTLPLVMHGTSLEAQVAGRRYMLYSLTGAAVAFMGVVLVTAAGDGGAFVMGGVLADYAKAHPVLVQLGYLCCFFGFGVKAAIFPLHAWLPMASVAPTPVTALLHAVAVVKAGVFAVIRVTYFSFGAQLLRGTNAQTVALVFAAATIAFGSTMAVREHHFKRRLAYSTIANLSYILLSCALMSTQGLSTALLHMLFHALMKITLFYCAGAVLVMTGRTMIESLRGLGRRMPFVSAVYALAALALAGMPGLPAFTSKWMIGTAALESAQPAALLGLGALLYSAVLTMLYVLAPAFYLFFRQEEGAAAQRQLDPGWRMKLTLGVLSVTLVLAGLFSNRIVTGLAALSAGVL